MTSGHFTSLPINSIWVNREKRQRRELRGIQELGFSLQAIGQLHPIIVTRENELKAGERRWTAAKAIGWTHINVQFTDELDEAQLQLLELEKNVRREDLTWQEQCLAVDAYHRLRESVDPAWDMNKTAAAIGIDRSLIGKYRAVAKEINDGNDRVKSAPALSTAIGITTRSAARKQASVLETVARVVDPSLPPPAEVKRAPLLLADFSEWAPAYSGPKFNFIHCDFPYGVNAQSHAQGAAAAYGGYDDAPDVYWKLLETLSSAMSNVVAESAHLMFWFSMDFYQETMERLSEMGWDVQRFPLIWHKSDNIGILPDPTRGPRRIYETCLIASRGDRPIVRSVSNVFSGPTSKRIHMSEKPINMLTKFMEMFVDESTNMLDPTCGSGNAVKAAANRGANMVLGLEKIEEFFNAAKGAYYNDDL